MKELNLTSPETSDVKFEVSHFPDGQQDVKITGFRVTRVVDWGTELNKHPIKIASRFNSFEDLELILCATKALRRVGVEEIHLYIPYLLGARSDRKFTDGGTSYLVDIVAPILNAQNYKTVTALDAHSDVAAACITNFQIVDNLSLVKFALNDINRTIARVFPPEDYFKQVVLVSPDAGSLKKIYHVVDQIDYKGDILVCSKYRNWEGALSRIEVPIRNSQIAKDFIIIDDICDGGRTFIEIAKVIKARANFTGNIYLIVTHGIFSKGFHELADNFQTIYCTNSYSELKPNPNFVKQLNVF